MLMIEEASRQYEIPAYIREEYEQLGPDGKQKNYMGSWECGRCDLEYMSLMITLHQIGFEGEEVKKYMMLVMQGEGAEAERMKMLDQKRDSTLDKIHFCEGQIALLDYLRYEIQK